MNLYVKKITSIALSIILLISGLNANVFGMYGYSEKKQPLLKGQSNSLIPEIAPIIFRDDEESSDSKSETVSVTVVPIHNSPAIPSVNPDEDSLLKRLREAHKMIEDANTNSGGLSRLIASNSSYREEMDKMISVVVRQDIEKWNELNNDLIERNKEIRVLNLDKEQLKREKANLEAELNDECALCKCADAVTCDAFRLSRRTFWTGCTCGTMITIFVTISCVVIIFAIKVV